MSMRSIELWKRMRILRIVDRKHIYAPYSHECQVIIPLMRRENHLRSFYSYTCWPISRLPSFSRISSVLIMHNGSLSMERIDLNKKNEANTLIERLELHINKLERVKFRDVEHLLQCMKSGVLEYSDPGLLLLRCCSNFLPDMSPSMRFALTQSVWDDLKAMGINLNVDYYNALLKCYTKNLYHVKVSEFLLEMGTVIPNEMTYHLLLECTCENGDLEQATQIIQLMKEKGFSANEDVFASLIVGYARAGDMKSSVTVVDTMRAAKLVPNARTYTVLLRSYAEYGDFKSLSTTYRVMLHEKIELSEHQVMDICKSLAKSSSPELITKFLALFGEQPTFSAVVRNTVLELVHLFQEKSGYFLLNSVTYDPVHLQGENIFAFFINEMCNANSDPQTVIEICNWLIKDEKYPEALHKAIESAHNMSRTDLAFTLLKELKKMNKELRPHYFWPIILQRGSLDGEKGVFATLQDMQMLGLAPDYETLADYVLPRVSLADASVLVKKLQGLGLSLQHIVTPVVVALLQAGQLRDAINICRRYNTRIDFQKMLRPLALGFSFTKDVKSTLNMLQMMQTKSTFKVDFPGEFLIELLSLKHPLRPEEFVKLLKEFQVQNMRISAVAADAMTKYFDMKAKKSASYAEGLKIVDSIGGAAERFGETSDIISHPRSMSREELEAHLVELKSKNMNTRGVLRLLFQHYCRSGDNKRALEVIKEFQENGFVLTPGMQSSLFDIHVRLKNVSEAESCLHDILHKTPNFIMDEYKIVDYATLLVSENQYKAALAALERRSVAGKIIGGRGTLSNCHRLISVVASTKDPEHTKHMLHVLVTHGFCSYSNVMLGPLIKSYINQCDWENAVREFKRCVKEFRVTPLKQELLQHLIAAGSEDQLISDFISAAKTVHGEINTLVSYAGALAENKKTKELQQLLSV